MSDDHDPSRPIESIALPLKPESLQCAVLIRLPLVVNDRCLYRFTEYRRKSLPGRIPKRRTAAVAIILFVGRLGDLYVLLSTRATNMRTYASDTVLPGGKYEEGDRDEEGTARREAYEEIGLPVDPSKVRCLTLLDSFLTGTGLIVTPVVFLVLDNLIPPILNPSEVTSLFSMPLLSFLHVHPSRIPGWQYGIGARIRSVTHPEMGDPPVPLINSDKAREGGVGGKEGAYYTYRDVPWGDAVVRFHRFLTGREGTGVKPVYGLTAAILIHAARIGYDQSPPFEFYAPGQKKMEERIRYEILHGSGPLGRAVRDEGMLMDWEEVKSKL